MDVIPRDFRVADTRRARVILLEAGERLLPELHADSSRRALAQLQELGVEVQLGSHVTRACPPRASRLAAASSAATMSSGPRAYARHRW